MARQNIITFARERVMHRCSLARVYLGADNGTSPFLPFRCQQRLNWAMPRDRHYHFFWAVPLYFVVDLLVLISVCWFSLRLIDSVLSLSIPFSVCWFCP